MYAELLIAFLKCAGKIGNCHPKQAPVKAVFAALHEQFHILPGSGSTLDSRLETAADVVRIRSSSISYCLVHLLRASTAPATPSSIQTRELATPSRYL